MDRANRKAEALLRNYLTPEQREDWKREHGFNVRGSDGELYRLSAGAIYSNASIVDARGEGFCAWPRGLEQIDADWALGMMFNLQADAEEVRYVACREPRHRTHLISDYGGKL